MKVSGTANTRFVALALDVVGVLFIALAAFHLAHAPALPDDLRSTQSVNGTATRGGDETELLLTRHRIGDTVDAGVSGPDGVSHVRCVLVAAYTTRHIIIIVLVSILFLFLGALVGWLRPTSDAARSFHWSSLLVAIAIVGSQSIIGLAPPILGSIACIMFLTAYSCVPASVVHVALVVPGCSALYLHRVYRYVYGLAIVVACWRSVTLLRAAASVSVEDIRSFQLSTLVFEVFLLACLTSAIVMLILSYRRSEDPTLRKKLRWVIYGVTVGTAPFLLLWTLPRLIVQTAPVPEEFVIGMLVFIPASFAISIVKYRLLDIDRLINRSVVYAIVVGTFVLLYAGVVGVIAYAFGSLLTSSSLMISVTVATFFAFGFDPLRSRVQHLVDRRFFRAQYNYREEQRNFFDEIKRALTVGQLGELIVARTVGLLPVERIGFFTLRENGSRLQLVVHRNFDVLAARSVRFEAENLRSRLQIPVGLPDMIEASVAFEPADAAVFSRWEMVLVLPMTSERSEVLGFLVLGAKKSGLRFTAEDVDLLSAVMTQAGIAIERITLHQQLLLEQEEGHRLQELNRLKSYFVSSVSHDLKTPLTSIRGYAERLLAKDNLDRSKVEKSLHVILGESDKLRRLIENVLDFSKIERGVREYRCSELDLTTIVRDVLRSMEYQFTMEQFEVSTTFPAEQCSVRCDRDAITRVLENLITNAIKYSEEIKHLELSVVREATVAAVRIADLGIGIAAQDLPNLFEAYYRADNAHTHGAGGTGLGLSVVKEIIDAHGGTIDVVSTPHKGSVFTFRLPLLQHFPDQSSGNTP